MLPNALALMQEFKWAARSLSPDRVGCAGGAPLRCGMSPRMAARVKQGSRMLILLRNKRCLAAEGSKVRGNFQILF